MTSASSNMPASTQTPALDHLIHLVPDLESSIALYSSLGFVVQRGGNHADGLTTNALIVLPDGVYIELIAFIPGADGESRTEFETRRSKHWWWGKQTGWIDWCLLGVPDVSSLGDIFDIPNRGGRLTPAGKHLQWEVTFPIPPPHDIHSHAHRGRTPFWCRDLTPREWRVPPPPTTDASPHPNGCVGVTALVLLFKAETINTILELYTRIFQQEPKRQEPLYIFTIAVPQSDSRTLPLVVKRAQDPQEREWIEQYGEGVYEVELGVKASELPTSAPPDGIERTTQAEEYGRLRFHPVA